ncbi:MAG: hypothetical protein WDM96_02360 [Lacunisphaera sp.]
MYSCSCLAFFKAASSSAFKRGDLGLGGFGALAGLEEFLVLNGLALGDQALALGFGLGALAGGGFLGDAALVLDFLGRGGPPCCRRAPPTMAPAAAPMAAPAPSSPDWWPMMVPRIAPATAPAMAPDWAFWFEPSEAQPELKKDERSRALPVLKMTKGR